MNETGAWTLAIDMGTTSTVVATRVGDRRAEVVEVDGQRTIPSVVFVDDDGSLPVGNTAVQLGAGRPRRAVRAPKRRLGSDEPIVVAGRALTAAELVAALLNHGAREATRVHGAAPIEVRLTHPVAWPDATLDQLRAASTRAGLGTPVLIPEPIAAAHSLRSRLTEGQRVAIYDLGGETFDTVALQAVPDGFALVSEAFGSRSVGGELLDEMIMAHVAASAGDEVAGQLAASEEAGWARANGELRSACRAAKESISSHPYAEVAVMTPAGLLSERLSGSDIEQLARPLVDQTMPLLDQVVESAGGVDVIQLVGGGSRMPLVADMIRQRFPIVEINQSGDPRAAVALGAASLGRAGSGSDVTSASPPTPPTSHQLLPPTPPRSHILEQPTARTSTQSRRWLWVVAAAGLFAVLGVAAWLGAGLLGDRNDEDPSANGDGQAATATTATVLAPSPTTPPVRRTLVGKARNGGDYVVTTADMDACAVGDLAVRQIFEVEPDPPLLTLSADSELVTGPDVMLIVERCDREVVRLRTGTEVTDALDPTTVAPLALDRTPLFMRNITVDFVDGTFAADARFERGNDWRSIQIDVTTGTVTDLGPSPDRHEAFVAPNVIYIMDLLTSEVQSPIQFGYSPNLVTGQWPSNVDPVPGDVPESCEGIFDEVLIYEGVALGFLDGGLAGWYLRPASFKRVRTPTGIGIGSHVRDIRESGAEMQIYSEGDRRMIRFSYDNESFGFGDFFASVSGDSDVDYVEEMYGGALCEELVFRFR